MSVARSLAVLLLLAGCGDGNGADAGMDGGDTDAGGDMDAGEDAGPPFDAGDDFRDFLAALDGTVWSGLAERDGVFRGFEMQFVGGGSPMWGEIRNPYGPARQRIRRFLRPTLDGCSSPTVCTVSTTISIPDSSWETPPQFNGRREEWTIEIIDGFPRSLAITNESTGIEEFFDEGAWPVPDTGLTAEVRTYEGGGPISTGFCTSGGDQMRDVVWEFARGASSEPTLAYDVVAGAPLGGWVDPTTENRFGIRDVDGFDVDTLGGSERTDQFFFIVRYTGVVEHPGGFFSMRERDDALEDAVWVFIENSVGSSLESDLFLEVHNFFWPDLTDDEVTADVFAGDVPIEIIVPRCQMNFEDDFHLEMSLDGSAFDLVRTYATRPVIDDTLFPPVL